MLKLRTMLLAVCCLMATSSTALAHPQHGLTSVDGLLAGFAHPWLGLDHLLAMMAVGMLGVQIGGRALWMLPCAFLGMMVLGGAAGIAGWQFPMVEYGIALSVVVLGIALAVGRKCPLLAAAAIIGAFGIFHGHAHGTEMPAMLTPAVYAVGFMAGTALLHLAGIACGLSLLRNQRWTTVLRVSGAAMGCVGLMLLLGSL